MQDVSRDSHSLSEEKTQLISKPRLTGSDVVKKHKPKPDEPRATDSFQELFGEPITKPSKILPDPKTLSKDKNSNISSKSDKGNSKKNT